MRRVDGPEIVLAPPSVRERPILFSAPMVRAILAGTKTQTRRAWREQPPPGVRVGYVPGETRFPYGQPGDQLWVRETWLDARCTGVEVRDPHTLKRTSYAYGADTPPGSYADQCRKDYGLKWRPSIHMPRAASRIQLEVTGVRVERLQDISDADARAEGAVCVDEATGREVLFPDASKAGSWRLGYRVLWESINGPGSWDANPWVWVVEFRRLRP